MLNERYKTVTRRENIRPRGHEATGLRTYRTRGGGPPVARCQWKRLKQYAFLITQQSLRIELSLGAPLATFGGVVPKKALRKSRGRIQRDTRVTAFDMVVKTVQWSSVNGPRSATSPPSSRRSSRSRGRWQIRHPAEMELLQ